MPHAEPIHEIRRQIQEKFVDFGAAPETEPLESILIRDGYYCGRRFDCDGLQAIWFIEENEIKFYGRDGSVQQVLQPRDEQPARQLPTQRRRAA